MYRALLVLLATSSCFAAQAQMPPQRGTTVPPVALQGANLPVEKIGCEDLVSVSVYYAPELSGTSRVEADGKIRLPMLRQRVQAAGFFPEQLEDAISKALVDEGILVRPVVTVTVMEYRSHPVTVSGAVRSPTTFQAIGTVSLLDAITTAGGIAENAGGEILISRRTPAGDGQPVPETRHIQIHSLLTDEDPSSNPILQGGEIIRVPLAGQVYVVGEVKKPGSFYLSDGLESSVLKALALSGGLESFPKHTAYIYRMEPGKSARSEIPIDLKKILDRKTPDVPLVANDILYIPDASGSRITAHVVQTSLGMSIGLATLLLYAVP